jgi:hypothetical protein
LDPGTHWNNPEGWHWPVVSLQTPDPQMLDIDEQLTGSLLQTAHCISVHPKFQKKKTPVIKCIPPTRQKLGEHGVPPQGVPSGFMIAAQVPLVQTYSKQSAGPVGVQGRP